MTAQAEVICDPFLRRRSSTESLTVHAVMENQVMLPEKYGSTKNFGDPQ